MLVRLAYPFGGFKADDIVDVAPSVARRLLREGRARIAPPTRPEPQPVQPKPRAKSKPKHKPKPEPVPEPETEPETLVEASTEREEHDVW